MGGIFPQVELDNGRLFEPCPHSLPFWLAKTIELWIAMGPRLRKVEGRYHMTAWNWFSSSFQYSNKKHDREGKILQRNLHGCKNVQIHLTD